MELPEEIQAEHVVVRPFREADLPPFVEFMTDPSATRYLMFEPEQKTRAGARELFDFILQSYASDEPVWALAIATETDGFVGSCGVSPVQEKVFECYYSLLPRYWGRGYATEAVRALIDHLFKSADLVEIRAYMSPSNPNSRGVAERIGLKPRGMHAHPVFGTEGLLYSISSVEWVSRR
jgi:RimJ/RimL family protein N-acetyltransferase